MNYCSLKSEECYPGNVHSPIHLQCFIHSYHTFCLHFSMNSDSSYGDDVFPPPAGASGLPAGYLAEYPSYGGSAGRLPSSTEHDTMMPEHHDFDVRAMGDMLKQQDRPPPPDTKKSKKSRMPKPPSFDVRGSFRKMQGVFQRGKDSEPLKQATSSHSIEVHEQDVMPEILDYNTASAITGEATPPSGYATPQPFDQHPGGYDLNPTDTLSRKQDSGRFNTMKTSVKNWFIPNDPPTRNVDVCELKPDPPKPIVRMSNIIHVVLLLGALIGIILLCFSSYGQHYTVLGPVFLGLSIFALIGKVFASLLWEREPCPRFRPYITKMEDIFGGARDPYRLKQPVVTSTYTMPRLSTGKETFPMHQYTYRYSNYPADDAALPAYAPQEVGYQPPDYSAGYVAPAYAPEYPPSDGLHYSYDEKPSFGQESFDAGMR